MHETLAMIIFFSYNKVDTAEAEMAAEAAYDLLQQKLHKRFVNERAEKRQRDHTKLTPEVMTTLSENLIRQIRGEVVIGRPKRRAFVP